MNKRWVIPMNSLGEQFGQAIPIEFRNALSIAKNQAIKKVREKYASAVACRLYIGKTIDSATPSLIFEI
jgi:hypothetical protein